MKRSDKEQLVSELKDKINAEVKHREPYRPFAPSAIAEARNDYFDIGVEDPFMSM